MKKELSTTNFKIECLDHVAIRVRDIETSRKWYEEVLGLTAYQLEVWGEIPVFLLAGTTGIALFPADKELKKPITTSKHVKIDHFAFRLSNADFEKAKLRYEELRINFQFQDHILFHSIYTQDPDGHIVELTTLMVDPAEFYKD